MVKIKVLLQVALLVLQVSLLRAVLIPFVRSNKAFEDILMFMWPA